MLTSEQIIRAKQFKPHIVKIRGVWWVSQKPVIGNALVTKRWRQAHQFANELNSKGK